MKDNSNKTSTTSTGGTTTGNTGGSFIRHSQCSDNTNINNSNTIQQQQQEQEQNHQHPFNHLYTILNTVSVENSYHIQQTNEYHDFCKIIYNQIQLQQLQQCNTKNDEATTSVSITTTTSSSFMDNNNNNNSMVICDEECLDNSLNNNSTDNDDIDIDLDIDIDNKNSTNSSNNNSHQNNIDFISNNDTSMDHDNIINPISPDSTNWKRKTQEELQQPQLQLQPQQPQQLVQPQFASESSSSSTCRTAGISQSTIASLSLSSTSTSVLSISFIQNRIADEILLKILDFLHCIELMTIRTTCNRINKLVSVNVHERIKDFTIRRQLVQPYQLLRAQEQIHGINTNTSTSTTSTSTCNNNISNNNTPYVPIPVLLLSRRIIITECGDTDYNGIYYCTGINGNGYVFTKPRYQRDITNTTGTGTGSNTSTESTVSITAADAATAVATLPDIAPQTSTVQVPIPNLSNVNLIRSDNDTEVTESDQALRCIIARRFSRETILWYLSKEMIRSNDNNSSESDLSSTGTTETDTITNASRGTISVSTSNSSSASSNYSSSSSTEVINYEVYQTYSFWANLADVGDATPDVCRYPSQTSILRRDDPSFGWQPLSSTRLIHPPIVELLP